MTNTGLIVTGELATSTVASSAISMSINAEPLLTALITLGVSIVTIVGGELVKYLVAWLQNKKKKIDLENKELDNQSKKDDN